MSMELLLGWFLPFPSLPFSFADADDGAGEPADKFFGGETPDGAGGVVGAEDDADDLYGPPNEDDESFVDTNGEAEYEE
ncbi:MAG: hypothetical protein AAB805_00365 [Patescibacteria group bacterium]